MPDARLVVDEGEVDPAVLALKAVWRPSQLVVTAAAVVGAARAAMVAVAATRELRIRAMRPTLTRH